MEITKLSSKGQIVLPKPMREARNWQPGTEFVVEEAKGGLFLRPLRPFPSSRLEEVAGSLPYSGKPKTLSQMRKAIDARVKERRGRGRY
ncbi:MAG: AbrB/MazE/SpoVT family DNA-binding domain-containing protein [Acidobacteriia bacterium]|nr:AbrB/MazE/SpoVT family DNA-binding domain-containing protein [Terriglobia bacterium]